MTYGAGGITQADTLSTVLRLKQETGLVPTVHLTCVGANREEVDDFTRRYWDAGVNHIVPLHDDFSTGTTDYTSRPGGYTYASDLVADLHLIADFDISVAACPEIHPAASSPEARLRTH